MVESRDILLLNLTAGSIGEDSIMSVILCYYIIIIIKGITNSNIIFIHSPYT